MIAVTRMQANDRQCLEAVRRFADELSRCLPVSLHVEEVDADESVDFSESAAGVNLSVSWTERTGASAPGSPQWEDEDDADQQARSGPCQGLARHYGWTLEVLGRNAEAARAFLQRQQDEGTGTSDSPVEDTQTAQKGKRR